ncbi:hypothetical protein ACFWTC_13095 [Streptomyces sp. NPDC058619]|uniref:hypothetical protein n=1 Tax=unclassified Streptomyces TaxID=2593676 RepID=UPI00365CECA9
MRSTHAAKTAKTTKTAAACLVVLAGVFVGTGGALAATEGAGTTVLADDMPWGVVNPLAPPRQGGAGHQGDRTQDMPWG